MFGHQAVWQQSDRLVNFGKGGGGNDFKTSNGAWYLFMILRTKTVCVWNQTQFIVHSTSQRNTAWWPSWKFMGPYLCEAGLRDQRRPLNWTTAVWGLGGAGVKKGGGDLPLSLFLRRRFFFSRRPLGRCHRPCALIRRETTGVVQVYEGLPDLLPASLSTLPWSNRTKPLWPRDQFISTERIKLRQLRGSQTSNALMWQLDNMADLSYYDCSQ